MAGFNWLYPLYAAIAALVIYLPLLLSKSFDIDGILYIFVLLPVLTIVTALILLIIAIRRKRAPGPSILSVILIYWIVSGLMFLNTARLRPPMRWLLWSKQYKTLVLAQPVRVQGELRHTEWDGWGMFSMDTAVYLVFDPNDSLGVAARSHSHGKFQGIPCEVPPIRRLESQWYSVQFYTDSDWEHCL
jgi:hypothetical protein